MARSTTNLGPTEHLYAEVRFAKHGAESPGPYPNFGPHSCWTSLSIVVTTYQRWYRNGLERNGAFPLLISLFKGPDYQPHLINSLCIRWHTLELEFTVDILSEVRYLETADRNHSSLRHTRIHSLQQLQILALQISGNPEIRHYPTHVSLQGLSVDLDNLGIELSDVTHFDADTRTPSDAIRVFRRAPGLTRFALRSARLISKGLNVLEYLPSKSTTTFVH